MEENNKETKEKKEKLVGKNIGSSETKKPEEKKILENTLSPVKDGIDIFNDDIPSDNFSKTEESSVITEATEIKENAGKENKSKKEIKGKKKKKKKKREIKHISVGTANIQATYNNTIITLTDLDGNVLAASSSGRVGFKGAKKSTPYAASIVARDAINKAKVYGLQSVDVYVKGVGAGKESAVRALNANGLNILSIKDITPIPHNGCRPKKPRRV